MLWLKADDRRVTLTVFTNSRGRMFLRFFVLSLLISLVFWYLHEFHTAQFMAVMRNIPYLSPLMAKLHSKSGSSGARDKTEIRDKLFSADDLRLYNGGDGSPGVYIAILGEVYDVGRGKKHYGPGGTYHVFAGRDASRAFISGDFSEDNVSDHVLDLELSDLLSLFNWKEFYAKDYDFVGKLIGRFFNENGEKTEYSRQLDSKLIEARDRQGSKDADKKLFPPCNVEWSADKGSRVWCSPRSGGVERSWPGVPRKLYQVGSDAFSCVCINLERLQDPEWGQYPRRNNLEEYAGCDLHSTSCTFNT